MTGNGHILPGTPIAIDMWDVKSFPQGRIFFLSHFHGDHIVGLTSSWKYPIYASPVTCQLVLNKLKVNPSLVKCLEVGEDHIISLSLDGQETMTVTLFDANHCPGSVMFLFSGYFGEIFYTADFRYKPNMLGDFQLPPIDVLYLDNTYCSPACNFPTREDATEKILSQLHSCLVQSERVYLGLDNLGKEDLLIKIAKETQSKIFVKPSRKLTMDILGLSDIVTTDEAASKILVVPTNQISGKNIILWNKDKKSHAILATARFSGFNFKPFAKMSEIHVIPYSNHSSYFELKKFVREIRPSSIIPIVGKNVKGIFGTDISHRADMSIFKEFLRSSLPLLPVIPEPVKRAMVAWEIEQNKLMPYKKRKIAHRTYKPFKRLATVGVKFIVSEDSETDSDPDAIHFNPKISVPSSDEESEFLLSEEDSSETEWEITYLGGKNAPNVFVAK